jgi:hypothetical protein
MVHKYRFYVEEGKWYIDLPAWTNMGGDKSALEMVFGADEFLKYLSEGKDEVFLQLWEKQPHGYFNYEQGRLFKSITPLESGAFYVHLQNPFKNWHVMWLCDVVRFVFNDTFPESIWFQVITKEDYENHIS